MKKILKINLNLFLILVLLAPAALSSDEGMWLPHQLKNLPLDQFGLLIEADKIYNPQGTGLANAVVSFGGGTGSFVSAEGLLLTNHHVAYSAIQRASSKENDYLANGFMAVDRKGEIPSPGFQAFVLLKYEDVSARVNSALRRARTPARRAALLERLQKEMEAAAERQGSDLRCNLRAMYNGNEYYLFTFKHLQDVRLVYAPPSSLGNFGGEIDNWMWPRHTADFTFMRAYVAPDGTGRAYHAENVPYRPASYLRFASSALKPGDATFIVGYPGRTYRNDTLAELDFMISNMEKNQEKRREVIDFLEKASSGDRGLEIKYAGRLRGLYNGLKNNQAKLEGFSRFGIRDRKAAFEKELLDWIGAEPGRGRKFAGVTERIASLLERMAVFNQRQETISNTIGGYAPTLLSLAHTIYRNALERGKPDLQREAGFQDRFQPQIRMRLEIAERSFDQAVDAAYFAFMLNGLKEQDSAGLPAAWRQLLSSKKTDEIEKYVQDLYRESGLGDPDRRLALFDMPLKELLAAGDPFIKLAAELEKEMAALRRQGKELNQELNDLKKDYNAALLARSDGIWPTDANGTIRFTHGLVQGYEPRDAVVFAPFTTLSGVVAKHSGTEPFIVPEKLRELHAAWDFGPHEDPDLQDVPACFLNTANVTGGNSGSPVLNGRGEVVGLVFDMTYESVIGDHYVIPELQRTINVDSRYILFIIDRFAENRSLLAEITGTD